MILVFDAELHAQDASAELNARFIDHDLDGQTITIDIEAIDSPVQIKPYQGLTAIII